MKQYLELLKEKKLIKHKIGEEESRLNKELVKLHPNMFKAMDKIIIIAFCINLLAVLLTNMMVVREKPDGQLYELNVVQAKLNKQEIHPDYIPLIKAVAIQLGLWFGLIFCYLFYRFNIVTERQLRTMFTLVVCYSVIMLVDFVNNFGYLLGIISLGG